MANLVFDFLHHYQTGERRESDPADAYQYDEGHVMEAVVPVEVTSCEIHYWVRGQEQAEAYVPDSIVQNEDGSYSIFGHIPNTYFETYGDLRVYIVVTDGSASITTYEGRIHICERSKPDDYVDDDPDNEATRVLVEAREAAATATAAAETCEEVLESIPSDYSDMSETVDTLSDDVSDLKSHIGDLSELETTAKTDLVSAINEAAQSGGGSLTEDIKLALLQIASKVVYTDEHGQDYYDALEDALYPSADLVSISAVYTQSGTVYDTDNLDILKSDLVVTALYDDQSTETVTTYTLSGTLASGTSTITVAYGGKTTTFDVTVSHNSALYNFDFTSSLVDTIQGAIASSAGDTEVSRSDDGIDFTSAKQCVDLGIPFAKGRTYELDFTDLDIEYTTAHNRLIMYGTAKNTGTGILLFRNNNGWAVYSGSWGMYGNLSTRASLGSSGTVKITVDSEGNCTLYLNGNLVGTSTAKVGTIADGTHVWLASNDSAASGGSIYNCKVTAFRVFEGVA